MRIGARTRLAAVIGRPVTQSLSPLIHNAWIEAAGLDAVYLAFAPEDEAELWALLQGLSCGRALGVNVTAPFKEQARDWAIHTGLTLGREAEAAGSVNLLVFEDGRGRAESTDGRGMIAAIREQAPALDLAAGPAVVLGAGGAARAAVQALRDEGASDIRVVNRSRDRAEQLAGEAGPGVSAWSLDQMAMALEAGQLLINAATAVETPDLGPLRPGAAVLDMTYRPLETPLLAAARARGLKPVDGLAMLIGQARPSFEAWFGTPPPSVDVRSLALKALETAR